MENDFTLLVDLWKQEVSRHVKEYVPYHATEQLKQMAALFAPGLYYFYVFNFQNLQMEYVHPQTRDLLGIPPENFSVYLLLEKLIPGETRRMKQKEALVVDFYYNFLSSTEIPDYKTIYFLRVCDATGNYRTLLHQMTPLTQNGAGKVIHVLAIHTDVTHLGLAVKDHVSFINLKGGKSYFNVDPEKGIFEHEEGDNQDGKKIINHLSNRELEVVTAMAKGLNAEEIADKLHVSFNTVRTHRKNILKKSGCVNTTELVARCVMEGVI